MNMGYYTAIDMGGLIKTGMEDKLRQVINQKVKEESESDLVEYYLDGVEIEDGCIVLGETWAKFYEDQLFIEFIAPYLQPQDIIFTGEDGAMWGYRIKEDGRVMCLTTKIVETGVFMEAIKDE